jgi:hypothetical protein
MTNPLHDAENLDHATDATRMTQALLERLDRSDRALRRWRFAAQLCAGVMIFGAGIAAGSVQSGKDASPQKATQPSPQQGTDAQSPAAASPPAQPNPQAARTGGSRMVGIALDLNPSGRWNSTLLAVDEDGVVYALNTAGNRPTWQRFQYSP